MAKKRCGGSVLRTQSEKTSSKLAIHARYVCWAASGEQSGFSGVVEGSIRVLIAALFWRGSAAKRAVTGGVMTDSSGYTAATAAVLVLRADLAPKMQRGQLPVLVSVAEQEFLAAVAARGRGQRICTTVAGGLILIVVVAVLQQPLVRVVLNYRIGGLRLGQARRQLGLLTG